MPPTTPPGKVRCPKDATIMERLPVQGFDVDHCARCGAIWFDPYELEATIKSQGGAMGIEAIDFGTAKHAYDNNSYLSGGRTCPRDGEPLIEIPDPRQPHVKIDVCRRCGGVLLDAGELKDLSHLSIAERLRGFFGRR